MSTVAAIVAGFSLLATGPHGGQLLQGTYPGTFREGLLYLPPGFTAARRYPVVYLLHGLPGGPAEYSGALDLLDVADASARPFIGVVPAAGEDEQYDGEWAGPWETALVDDVVPFVDRSLPTLATGAGRVLAGLSAGGFGAIDIGLRHPGLFDTLESWSGYFAPLRDGPFTTASRATLAANDPVALVRAEATTLRRDHVRFFLSTGPAHSNQIDPASTDAFAREARSLGLDVAYRSFTSKAGEWRRQFDAGLAWAL